jgi:hypothetical protein
LQQLVDTGRGDVPLIHLPFRCQCGWCRTGIICTSAYGAGLGEALTVVAGGRKKGGAAGAGSTAR